MKFNCNVAFIDHNSTIVTIIRGHFRNMKEVAARVVMYISDWIDKEDKNILNNCWGWLQICYRLHCQSTYQISWESK